MKAVGLDPANSEALIDAIAANHGLKAHRDAHLKAQRKPQVAHEDEAQLA